MRTNTQPITVLDKGIPVETIHEPRKLIVYFHNKLSSNYLEAATNIKNLAKPFGKKAIKAALIATHPDAPKDALDNLLALIP